MWTSWVPACFADHLCGIKPTCTSIIDTLYWNHGQKLHLKWIRARRHFNKQCKSRWWWSWWLRSLSRRSFTWSLRSQVQIPLQTLSKMTPEKVSLCTPSVTVRLHSRLRIARTLRGKSLLYSVTIMPLERRKILFLNFSLWIWDTNQNKQPNTDTWKFSNSKWS